MCRRLILGIVLAFELILVFLVVREVRDFEGHYRSATDALLMDSAHLAAALLAADLQKGRVQSDRIRIALPVLRRLRARVNQNQAIPPGTRRSHLRHRSRRSGDLRLQGADRRA